MNCLKLSPTKELLIDESLVGWKDLPSQFWNNQMWSQIRRAAKIDCQLQHDNDKVSSFRYY